MVNDNDITIRQMEASDLSDILDIDRKIQGASRAASYNYPDIDNFKGLIDFSYVAVAEEKTIGFILGNHLHIGEPSAEIGLIQILGIEPDFRGRKIGKRLVDAFTKAAIERGLKTVRVMLREDDSQLAPFFTKMNFERGRLIDYLKKL